ncbi:MAG: flavodoxin [Lachnospiraceae bacterium]|jgi:flavodoxin|uniref:flavodoxin n=1 Tax=Candidatus Merdisoma sp. JLR.KK006 TaxID=3112626 RepID=UPI002FF1BCD9|nr:flavodoxin [Lachnospiraceae bacterium]
MKKEIFLLPFLLLFLMMAGCQNKEDAGNAAKSTLPRRNGQTEQATDYEQENSKTENQELQAMASEPEQETDMETKTLVVYFSATGNTKQVANVIAETTGGDLFELEPVEPYSSADLDWANDDSRVARERENPDQREVKLVSVTVDNWNEVSVVYLGYPIWWGISAWPVDSFVKANDFAGKVVIPFCTSSSSDLGESGELLAEMAGTGEWQEGMRFSSGVSDEDVKAWVESLGL